VTREIAAAERERREEEIRERMAEAMHRGVTCSREMFRW
jgi:hypothetical protein